MIYHTIVRSIACAALVNALCACGGGESSPSEPSLAAGATHFTVGSYSAQFTEYPILGPAYDPTGLAVGSDGAVWVLVKSTSFQQIFAFGNNGYSTEYSEEHAPGPFGSWLTRGADGRLWFSGSSIVPGIPNEPNCEQDYVGAVAVSGALSTYTPTPFCPNVDSDITGNLGLDSEGNLWFIAIPPGLASVHRDGTLGKVLPALPAGNANPSYIASGPDGKLYLSLPAQPRQNVPARLYRIDPLSATILATFSLPSNTTSFANGDDGNLWLTQPDTNEILRMTPSGTITSYQIPTFDSRPTSITAGSDGALWFTESGANAIGRITTAGEISEYPVPTPNSGLDQIISCPRSCENAHGRLWFTESAANKVGKFEF